MKQVILLKAGEIVLKGLNRRSFEEKLISNMRRRLSKLGTFNIKWAQSTYFVDSPDENADVIAAAEALRHVFGIVSVSVAVECEKDMDAIIAASRTFLAQQLAGAATFKVEARRSDKHFPLNSPQICNLLGGELLDAFPHLTVDVHSPDLTVTAEIRDYGAYIHGAKLSGAGGMPVGTSGKAVLLLSGGIDSPVAGYMMAKRGLALTAVHFESPPYTSERARNKVLTLAEIMEAYCGRLNVYCVPFTKAQEAIRDRCPEDLFTLIMRRSMMRIAERIGEKHGAQAVVTGESLGQVASQTIGGITVTDAAASLPVLRPLIGMDKEEIVTVARRIGTMETSIQPYEDCCTVFTPKHPRLRPKLAEVDAAETAAGLDELLTEAADTAEIMSLRQQ